jgi:hypothetical protein
MICPPYDAARLMAHPIPAAVFGRAFWSPMICAGQAALSELPAGSWMRLRYEDLIGDPAAALTRLAAFAGVGAPPPWLDQAVALAGRGTALAGPGAARRPGVGTATAAAELDPDAFAALRAACEPGTRALDREAA